MEAVPAKPGSAKERMFQDLRKKAKTPGEVVPEPAKPATAPKPDEATPVKSGASDDQGAEAGAAAAPAGKDGKKVSPWKLVEEYKKRVAESEARIAELTGGQKNEEQRKAEAAQIEAMKRRAMELEDEIRYVNYSKSAEFQQKYQEPYNKAWQRAMSELSEISVQDPSTGETRAVEAGDMLQLVNMPLGQARDVAEQMFGKFADDVMTHRKEIRSLYEAQAAALDEAKKMGATREQMRMAQFQEFQQKTAKLVGEVWQKANDSAVKDEKFGKYFNPVEGDDEGNAKLEKGYALVDKAFSENPFAPNLKPEERQAIIRRHAAVRNRAAAFGRLTTQVEKAQARIAELERELKQYKGSEPPTAGGAPATATAQPTSAMERMKAELRARAKY